MFAGFSVFTVERVVRDQAGGQRRQCRLRANAVVLSMMRPLQRKAWRCNLRAS